MIGGHAEWLSRVVIENQVPRFRVVMLNSARDDLHTLLVVAGIDIARTNLEHLGLA